MYYVELCGPKDTIPDVSQVVASRVTVDVWVELQIHGVAMGFPGSMIMCDARMEDVEEQVIATESNPV